MSNVNKAKLCSTCGRGFGTQQALQQHCYATHGKQLATTVKTSRTNVGNRGRALVPRINSDGSAWQPDQMRTEATFGSSATQGRLARPVLAGSGVQEAVAGVIGHTPEGRAWAMAALHPCGAGEVVARNVGVINGMCDTMTSAVATPIYRSENHISYSQRVFPTADIPKPTTYGIDIIVPPIPEIDFCYRLLDDSTGQKSGWIVVRLPDFSLPPPVEYGQNEDDPPTKYHGYVGGDVPNRTSITTMQSVGYGKVRQIAVGHTFELDAAGLNDQGRVIVGQMEGQWRQMPLSIPRIDYSTSSFVTDAANNTKGEAVTKVEGVGPESSSNVWFLDIQTDPGIITASCPNAYQGLAKHGAYVVQKFTSPLLGYAFKRTGSGEVLLTGEFDGKIPLTDPQNGAPFMPYTGFAIDTKERSGTLRESDAFWSLDPKSSLWSAFGNAGMPISAEASLADVKSGGKLTQYHIHPGVSEPSDMMTAVIMFRNLPAGGSSGVTSSVRVKSRNYYEAISNGLNPAVAPYVHPPAQFDFQALNSVIIAGKQLADAYPASANSMSTILAHVWQAIRDYVKPVAGAIGGLNLPIASGVARLIEHSITSAEAARGKWQN